MARFASHRDHIGPMAQRVTSDYQTCPGPSFACLMNLFINRVEAEDYMVSHWECPIDIRQVSFQQKNVPDSRTITPKMEEIDLDLSDLTQTSESGAHSGSGWGAIQSVSKNYLRIVPLKIKLTRQRRLLQQRSSCMTCSPRFQRSVA